MATFTIGGGNQANISPFLTGKATPMSLPPGYLSAAAQQAARLQSGISGMGEDIGDMLVARAKEEELKKEGIAYLMSTNKNLQKYPMFAAKEVGDEEISLPTLPDPVLHGDISSWLVPSDVDPRVSQEMAYEKDDPFLYEKDDPYKVTTKTTQPPNPLQEILGGEAWEKIASGDVSKGELRGFIRGVDDWKERKHGEVVRELNQMKLDALKKKLAEDKAFRATATEVYQGSRIPDKSVTEIVQKTMAPSDVDELFREEVRREQAGEPYDPGNVLLREQFRSQEDFETRVPEPMDIKTTQEMRKRDALINLINQSQGLPQLSTQPPAFQDVIRESFDSIPPEIMERAQRGDARAIANVSKAMKGAQTVGPIATQAEMDAHLAQLKKDSLITGTPVTPQPEPGWVYDLSAGKYVRDPSTDPLPGADQWALRTPEEERIRQLKRGYKPKADGSGFEEIKDFQEFPMGDREISAADVRKMKPEDQALYSDLVEPLYAGGEMVIGEEEVERVIPGREKSPTELRGEIQRSLMDSGQWTPDTRKKLNELIPEYAPGVLKQAEVEIGGVEMAVPGFMFDPIGKKYIEISTGKPIEFNEIQTKLAAYRNLMKSAQRDVDEVLGEDNAYDPTSAIEYWQRVSPTYLASKKGLEYKDAAGRWIEARLRFATGAQAPATEYEKDWKNFFPVPGDSKRAVDRKKRARDEVYRTLSKVLGAERTSYLDEGAPPAGATGGTSGKFSFQGGKLKLSK